VGHFAFAQKRLLFKDGIKSKMETPFELWKGKCIVSARKSFSSEHNLMLRTAGQLRTFNQLQASWEPLIQSRQVTTPVCPAPVEVRPAPIQARRTTADVSQDLDDLDKGTEIFQQMLLTGKLPWVSEPLKSQAANSRAPLTEQASKETMSQGPAHHVPRRSLGLNPEATEFQTTQTNGQPSKSVTSGATQSEVSARNYTMSAALERIEMLEIEVEALEATIKEHCETYTCRKIESQSESELRFPKQFSEGSSLLYLHQLEVDDGSSSNLIQL
jgi:hypothetical protein